MSKSHPNGYYEFASEWVAETNARYDVIYPGLDDIKHLPYRMDGALHWKHANEINRQPPTGFVTVIPNGRVWGNNGTIVTPHNKVLWELSIEYRKDPESLPIFHEDISEPFYMDKNVAVLSFCASDTYYHWMLDVLPRLELLSKFHGPTIDAYVCKLDSNCRFQQDTLHKLGISDSKIIATDSNFHLQAQNLIVPSLVGYTGHAPAWACDYLRNHFLHSDMSKPAKSMQRIYLSRQQARWRKVENEEEVIRLLRKYHFEIITNELDDMPVSEQADLFHTADYIVGPHGSGLTNVLFCHPHAKVLEFHSPNYVNPLYWVLGNHVEVDYYYLIGEGPRPPDMMDPKEDWEHMTIDVGKLEQIIKVMGC
jgi:hypothetical protein